MNTDAAESPLAATYDHPSEHILEAYCPHCEHQVDAVCPACRSNVESNGSNDVGAPISLDEFHRQLLTYLIAKKNTKVAAYCFLIATGTDAGGWSMTLFAKRFGICRGTVSKYCREIVERFNLQPSRAMLTEENARKFKFTNRRPTKTHARNN